MATEFVVYCNKCGAKMVEISSHPGKQAWICEECREDQGEVDISIFLEESKTVYDWRTARCGGCANARSRDENGVAIDYIATRGICLLTGIEIEPRCPACVNYELMRVEDLKCC